MRKWMSETSRVTIYIKALRYVSRFRNASHFWRSFSHSSTKINIQFLNDVILVLIDTANEIVTIYTCF